MAIFIFEYMSLKMRSAVFSFFGSFHYDREKKNRWIESTYYFAEQK